MKALIMVSLLLGAATAFAAYNTVGTPDSFRRHRGMYGSTDFRGTSTAANQSAATSAASGLASPRNY